MVVVHKKALSAVKRHAVRVAAPARSKTVIIKHHHAKPYRKRHVSALFLFIILSSVLITWLIIYRQQSLNHADSAQSYLSEIFSPTNSSQQTVSSTYGFSLQYDARSFNGSAIDAASGDLFSGQELSMHRAYQTVRVATGANGSAKNTERTLTMNYYDKESVISLNDPSLAQLERKAATTGVDTANATVNEVSRTTQSIDNVTFRLTEWVVKFNGTGITAKTSVRFRTYAGVAHGKAMIIKVTFGLGTTNNDALKSVINSIKFSEPKQSLLPIINSTKSNRNHSLLNTLSFTQVASAAPLSPLNNYEQISSRYSPAVVKIYNAYCMDISIDDLLVDKGTCNGSTGTGFFIDGSGTIATNGHVISSDLLDIIISDSVTKLTSGDASFFQLLAKIAGVSDADFKGNETDQQIANIVVDKMYTIDPKRLHASNNVTNLIVGLNEKQPDIKELVADTKNLKEYPVQGSIKRARVIAKDFRVIDGITSFKASDVALIKIEGSNYPVTKLGSIANVSQGSSLMILGYPGEASNNGLVDSTVSKPTLTAGNISSIKTVSGSSKKLIETDATIGHGNSGGPVFDQYGNVIGIATYTIDGSGSGDGIYNYIRDIQDLKDLASKNSISLNGTSQSQAAWDKGIDQFYNAHYSEAVKNFAIVRRLYPENPRVNELIATSVNRIDSGQDVKKFPVVLAGIAVAAMIGALGMVLVILRHHKTHLLYMDQIKSGAMQLLGHGRRMQVERYDHTKTTPDNTSQTTAA